MNYQEVNFKTLSRELQLHILETLLNYNECYLEHANNKLEVRISVCISSSYPADYYVSQTFTRNDFPFDEQLEHEIISDWHQLCEKYDSKTYFENDNIYMADKMVELRNAIYEAQVNCYLSIILDKINSNERLN